MIGVRGKELSPQTVRQYRWDAKHKEQVKAYRAEWRADNIRHRLDVGLRYRHGITLEQYEEMVVAQNGLCAICKKPPRPGRRLAVDHNHSTSQIRKLLCNLCNRYIGYVGEDPTILQTAIAYVQGEI